MNSLREWMMLLNQRERKKIVSALFEVRRDARMFLSNIGEDPSLWDEFTKIIDDIYHSVKNK